MATQKMTSGLMADAVLGGSGDLPEIGNPQTSYAEAIQSMEKHSVGIKRLIESGQLVMLSAETCPMARIADDLCRLALQRDSGVSMSSIGEIVQQVQKVNSICVGLSCIREVSDVFANGRLEELNGLIASLKTFCKATAV